MAGVQCQTAPVAFHDLFWAATSAVAPVTALASAVLLPDSLAAAAEAASAVPTGGSSRRRWWHRRDKRLPGARTPKAADSDKDLDEAYQDLAETYQEARDAEIRLGRMIMWQARRTHWLIIGNIWAQAALLLLSLEALASGRDVFSVLLAIYLAVGGIAIVGYVTAVAAKLRRFLVAYRGAVSSTS